MTTHSELAEVHEQNRNFQRNLVSGYSILDPNGKSIINSIHYFVSTLRCLPQSTLNYIRYPTFTPCKDYSTSLGFL